MEEIIRITDYILTKGNYTPKQVQKLLFYAYSLYLVKYNKSYSEDMKKLFKGDFEATEHGPVNIKVHNYLKGFRVHMTARALYEKKNQNFLDKVLLVYGRYSGLELEEMTKQEAPWIRAYSQGKNTIISDKDIFEYYSKYKK